jgi:hypothetical protein
MLSMEDRLCSGCAVDFLPKIYKQKQIITYTYPVRIRVPPPNQGIQRLAGTDAGLSYLQGGKKVQ